MCDLSQGLGLLSTLGQAKAASSADALRAQVATQNANLADQQANEVQEQKQQQDQEIQERKRQTIGTQRAAMAANGADSSYGTGLATITDTAYNAQQDINNTEINADQQSTALRSQAQDYKNAANIYNANSKSDMMGGILGATGSYLASLGPYSKKNSLFSKYGTLNPNFGGSSGVSLVSTDTNGNFLFGPNKNSFKRYNLLG